MSTKHIILVSAMVAVVASQRSPYAGRRPIGFPVLETTAAPTTSPNPLGNKFGENTTTTTTQRLPIEALGDRDLVNRLGELPVDKQPFWFINWQALEQHRKEPHSYAQNSNPFIDRLLHSAVQPVQINPQNNVVQASQPPATTSTTTVRVDPPRTNTPATNQLQP